MMRWTERNGYRTTAHTWVYVLLEDNEKTCVAGDKVVDEYYVRWQVISTVALGLGAHKSQRYSLLRPSVLRVEQFRFFRGTLRLPVGPTLFFRRCSSSVSTQLMPLRFI